MKSETAKPGNRPEILAPDPHAPPYPFMVLCSLLFFGILTLSSCSSTGSVSPTLVLPTETSAAVKLGPTSTTTKPPPARPTAIPTPTLRPIDPITEVDWARGADEPAVQVLVYSDFQCPYCADLAVVIEEMLDLHPDEFQLVFRHFPLVSIHDKAFIASQAAEAAGAQGQFWMMHDLLFALRAEWIDLSPVDFLDWVLERAQDLDLDFDRFESELRSGRYAPVVKEAYDHAIESGIPGTPFIFFNGFWFRLNPTLLNMEAAVRLELLGQKQFASPPTFEIDPEQIYFANLQLAAGTITIQLLPEYAPVAVANFIYLAEAGWFDNMPIYAVSPGRLVETGDPSGTGFGGPGYSFPDEITPQLGFDQPGMVAMSSSGPDTNGSQFFISLAPLPELDGARTIFGRVTAGLDYLRNLPARDALEDLLTPAEGVIKHVEIEIR